MFLDREWCNNYQDGLGEGVGAENEPHIEKCYVTTTN